MRSFSKFSKSDILPRIMSVDVGNSQFDKIEEEILRKTKDSFELFYPIYWSGLKTLQKALDLLTEENIALEDKYVTVLLVLANRSLQHLESMRILTERGLYGDAFVLSRSLMSNMAMIQYLRYKPEFVEDFLNETKEDYQNKKSGFQTNFNENIIHKVLTDAGVPSFSNSFQVLSKTSHASAFGAQFYGSRGAKEDQYHLKYGPGYESEKALALLAITSAGHFDLLDNIFVYRCQRDPTLAWENILTETDELKEQVEIFSESALTVMNNLLDRRK